MPYFVIEYIDGNGLAKRVRKEGPRPVTDVLDVAIQVADAFQYAREKGVIQRDIKPNCLVTTRAADDEPLSAKVLAWDSLILMRW